MPSLTWNETRDRAIAFAREWKDAAHEEGQKHLFWNEFFACFGIPLKTVAVFERAVANLRGAYSFIDLFWPGVLLVEHKSRGASLDKAGSQAFAYLADLAREGRHNDAPRYVVLCDFARFVLYDLAPDEQKDLPLFEPGSGSAFDGRRCRSVEFPLADLHRHVREFAFMRGERTIRLDPESPANMQATELLAGLHDALEASGLSGHALEHILVRILFCLFAEDTGIFEPAAFTRLVEENSEDGKILGGELMQLFSILNTPESERQRNVEEDLAAFPYVNGGLFAEYFPLVFFSREQRDALLKCCRFYWATISPGVFGSLFQGVLEKKERRQLGAHYTSERDILKLLNALFLDDLRTELGTALADKSTRRTERLRDFQKKLRRLRVFDPACGCGNFLILAYRELRRLENSAVTALHTDRHGKVQQQLNVRDIAQVDVDQFYGLEIGEWPVRIAEVGLWLTDHQCNVELAEALGQTFRRLPLRASPTIKVCNALREDWRAFLPPHDDVLIVGNPPFVGGKFQTAEQRDDIANVCIGVENYGLLDYVAGWYVKAAQYITGTGDPVDKGSPRGTQASGSTGGPPVVPGDPPGTSAPAHVRDDGFSRASRASGSGGTPDPTGQRPVLPATLAARASAGRTRIRCAFVSTNSITQGEQAGTLWNHLFQHYGIKIHFAHRTFSWMSEARGKAHVHVVIVGFGAFDTSPKRIYDADAATGKATAITVSNISPYLVEGPDKAIVNRSKPLCAVAEIGIGNKPIDGGHYLFTPEERAAFLATEPGARPYFRCWLGAEEFINGIERWCLWLGDVPPNVLRTLPECMKRVEAVRAVRAASKSPPTRKLAETPTRFHVEFMPKGKYLVIPEVSSERRRYIPIGFLGPDVLCSNKVRLLPGATLFHFGILTSAMHMAWTNVVTGRLESRYQYSVKLVYNNYPWPEPVAAKDRASIEEAAQAVLEARAQFPGSTLADLYDPLTMPAPLARAHAALDRAVDRAYAAAEKARNPQASLRLSAPFASDRERVEHLFALYERLTAPLLPAEKPKRTRKPAGLYTKKQKAAATGESTPQSEADAAHFHGIIGKEEPARYAARGGGIPAPQETPHTGE